MNSYEVLRRPVITEKNTLLNTEGKYIFEVARDSNKLDVKRAVEEIFKVEVASINTMNRIGKTRRTKFGLGKRKDTKRAIVTLKSGSSAEQTVRDATDLTAAVAPWLQADHEGLTGKVLKWPERVEIDTPVQEQLIVELYSK